ncbi:MAG: alpha/beta fold hydrolase [Acidimicrobiales bacterium]
MAGRAGSGSTGGAGRWIRSGALVGAGVAIGGTWLAQHRMAARAVAAPEDLEAEGLAMPDDLVHHFVDTDDGGRIDVVERGDGPALLLLHGVTLSCATWVNQLRELAAGFRVLAMDQRGHGRSSVGSDGFGEPGHWASARVGGAPAMRRLAADVAAVIGALDLDTVIVVGHSMGGMVTLQLAHDAPDELRSKIAGLALVATTAGPLAPLPGWTRAVGMIEPLARRSVLAMGRRSDGHLLRQGDAGYWASRIAFGPSPSVAQVRYAESMITEMDAGSMADLLGALAGFNLSGNLAEIETPSLVVVGTHDRLTPPGHARRLVASLPDAEMVDLARCGHMVMLERPRELDRLLGEFAGKLAA